MKKKNKMLAHLFMMLASVSVMLVASCSKELDNRDYPTSKISGRFLYKGEQVPIMYTASDAGGSNMLQLTQTGPGKFIAGNIRMFAKGDGTFSILTYDGDYTLNVTPGKGPWLQPPPLTFTLKGEASNMDFNVTPYHWMSDYKSTFVDSVFTATFKLEKIVPTAALERVVIYFGTTILTDITSKQAERVVTGIVPGNVTVSFNLKNLTNTEKTALRNTGTTFASVGIKTVGVSDLLYSKVMPLK